MPSEPRHGDTRATTGCVIPLPARVATTGRAVRLGPTVTISGPASVKGMLVRFAADVARDGGPEVRIGVPAAVVVELVETLPELAGVPATVGLSPWGDAVDESYVLEVAEDRVTVRAVDPAGVHRGLTTLRHLLAGSSSPPTVAVQQIVDRPRLAWRGFSLDVARCFLPLETVRGFVDLLSLYKLNVLHLHLADNEGWRVELPDYPALTNSPDDSSLGCYTLDELRELADYAAERFVVLVPELDTPGHSGAVLRAYPELGVYRPAGEFPTAYLDPAAPALAEFRAAVVAALSTVASGPYAHLGGDEAFGMPGNLYARYLPDQLAAMRTAGITPVVWQEAAGPWLQPGDVVQCWADFADQLPVVQSGFQANQSSIPSEVLEKLVAHFRRRTTDLPTAVNQGAWILMSPTTYAYFDAPWPDAPPGAAGSPHYPPRSLEHYYRWDPLAGPAPADRVAGAEAALWCETVRTPADAQYLTTARLPGFAERTWSAPGGTWPDYEYRLAAQQPIWAARGWASHQTRSSTASQETT